MRRNKRVKARGPGPGRDKWAKVCIQLTTWFGRSDHMFGDNVAICRGRGFWDADILIADTKPITITDLDKREPYLRAIVRPGVGYDNVPLAECKDRGIICAYTPNAPSQAVAEWAFGMMVCALRRFHRSGRPFRWGRHMGRSLSEVSVGIVGLGRIGKRLASMVSPYVGRLYGCDPVHDTTFDEINRVDRVDLETLLAMSDIVSLHVPKTPETEGLIGAAELTLMGDSGIILNCSRGGIVSEGDLASHLEKSPEFTACVDVFSEEPYNGPLIDLDNAILTSHMGAMTTAARERMEREGIEAALSILEGGRPQWVIPYGLNDGTD